MSINNITRNDTIDAWRIQTNQSANALNTLETGYYRKSTGTLELKGNSEFILSSEGTPLQVSNNALIQGNTSISKDLFVGASGTAKGNAGFGGVVTIYGPDHGLIVDNSASVGVNMIIHKNATANNLTVNNSVTVGADATVSGIVRLNNSGTSLYVNTGSIYVNTATVINATVTNAIISYADIETAEVTTETVTNSLITTGNVVTLSSNSATTNYLNNKNWLLSNTIQANVSVTTGTLNATGTAYANFVQANTGANASTITVTGTTYTNILQANTSANTGILTVTQNTSSGNVNVTNAVVAGSIRASGDATVTGNTSSGNVNVTNAVVAGSARISGTIQVTGNTSVGNLVVNGTSNVIEASNVRISGNISTSTLQASSNITALNAINVTNAVVAGSIRASGDATVTGNTSSGNVNVTNAVVAGSARISGDVSSATATVTGNTSSGNVNVTNAITTNAIRVTDSLSACTISTTSNTTVGGAINVTNAVVAGSIRTSGTLQGGATTLSSASVTNNLEVQGSLILMGPTVIDSDSLILRANTPQPIGSGYSYLGVRRTQSAGDTANANAHIRWSETTKTWDIRDVDNPTSYSKILTANLISDSVVSTSSSSIASSKAANTLGVAIQTANTFLQANDATTLATSKSYTDTANTFLQANDATTLATSKSYTNTSNTAMKSYVDGKFFILDTSTPQTVANNVTFSKDITVSGNLTVSGATTYVNSSNLAIGDAIIVLNADLGATSPSENAGIEINRGTSSNTLIRWNETGDYWDFTNNGSTYYKIPVSTTDLGEGNNLYLTSARIRANVSAVGNGLEYNSSTGVFNHKDTSSVANTASSAGTFLSGITFDEFGHVNATTFTNESTDFKTVTASNAKSSYTWAANTGSAVAETRGDTLTVVGGNNIVISSDASNDAILIEHTNSGITAATYGDSISIPVTTVDARGHITGVTSITVRSGTTGQTGVIQLTDSTSSTSTTTAATPNSVKSVYDYAAGASRLSFSTIAANGVNVIANASISTLTLTPGTGIGIVGDANNDKITINTLLTDSVTSTSTTTAATPNSVKSAYDRASTSWNAANTAQTTASTAQTTASSAFNAANTAQTTADTKFSSSGGTITGSVSVSGVTTSTITTPIVIKSGTNGVGNVGQSDNRFGTVYANYLNVSDVNTTTVTKSGTNGVGNVGQSDNRFNVVYGRSTSAEYADLAEKYITDHEYEPGTVIVVAEGGDSEATASFKSGQHVIGVVSTNPAHIMNDDSNGQAIGLTGRLPVKVVGPIKRGQTIISASDGKAMAGDGPHVFGQALETNLGAGVKLVECIIK